MIYPIGTYVEAIGGYHFDPSVGYIHEIEKPRSDGKRTYKVLIEYCKDHIYNGSTFRFVEDELVVLPNPNEIMTDELSMGYMEEE